MSSSGPEIQADAPSQTKNEDKKDEKSVGLKSDNVTDTEKSETEDGPYRRWLHDCMKRLESIITDPTRFAANLLSVNEVSAILHNVMPFVMEDGSLAECEAPCKVIGDIHGQFHHMHMLFDLIGKVPQERMMFLGDYVDRGPYSVEVVLYLCLLKIRYPSRIYLLRGNHETPGVNKIYGFYAECANKFGYPGVGLWYDFQAVFNRLPMAGLIGKKILCMHGGLSPDLSSLDDIRGIIRPCEPLDKGLLIDTLWSDPTNKTNTVEGDGWFYSIRGVSYMFGKAVVAQMCEKLGIDLIIRGHQVVQDGYEFMAGRKLITVFSAPNYINEFSNAAAVVSINHELKVSFHQMLVPLPAGSKAQPAPVVASDPDEPKIEPASKKDYSAKDSNNNNAAPASPIKS